MWLELWFHEHMSSYDTYRNFIAEQGWDRDDVSCDLENSIRADIDAGITPTAANTYRASDGRIYGRFA